MDTKECTKCGDTKEITEFHKDKRLASGRRASCKACDYAYNRQNEKKYGPWRRAEWDRKSRLKRQYGLTPEEYDELFEKQGGKCAICGKADTTLCVDHDHDKVGKESVRGLLCHSCNRGIGLLGDTTDAVEKALEYLRRNN